VSWGLVAVAGATLVKGAIDSNSAKKAGKAQQAGYDAASLESARQYDQTREDMAPWLTAGTNALAGLTALQNDPNSINQSEAYRFRFNQGLQGLDRSAAARGSLFSGGADADRIAFGQGLASQEYGDQWNRLAGLAGVGQTTANQLGQFGAQNAMNLGNYAIGSGNARASAYRAQGNAWGNALTGIAGIYGEGMGNNWGR